MHCYRPIYGIFVATTSLPDITRWICTNPRSESGPHSLSAVTGAALQYSRQITNGKHSDNAHVSNMTSAQQRATSRYDRLLSDCVGPVDRWRITVTSILFREAEAYATPIVNHSRSAVMSKALCSKNYSVTKTLIHVFKKTD